MTKLKPQIVALPIVINENKILLMKRKLDPFAGNWCFPGGKVEHGEHVSEAAIRELLEETGIKARFKEHLGIISEHVIEENKVINHFVLHVCEVIPETLEITSSPEGEVRWFDLDKLDEIKSQFIPSDFSLIEKIVKNREKGYYESVIEKQNDSYILRKFEQMTIS